MAVRNKFLYNARWESAGINCTFCKYCELPEKWPDKERKLRCKKHNISLAIILTDNGFCNGEWICKDFEDNGRAFPEAVKIFKEKIKKDMQEGILYELGEGQKYLEEYPMNKLSN